MSFKSLIGNEHNKDLLQRALRGGRLPHALILAGPEGIGKRQFALTLAKAINCEKLKDDSCDKCRSCLHIDKSESIDLKIIEPDGAFIKIGQIRELTHEALTTPMEGRKRIFILDPADKMNETSMNGLLKTLEEPADTSLIILITAKPDALLSTIRSRSQIIRFASLSTDQVEQFLKDRFQRPPEDTRLLARISGGSLRSATTIDLSVYREHRQEMIDVIEWLTRDRNRVRLVKFADAFGRREREDYENSLEILCSLLRDITVLIADNSSEQIANEDIRKELQNYADVLDIKTISKWFDGIEELRRNLRVNINRPVSTESLFLRMESNNPVA